MRDGSIHPKVLDFGISKAPALAAFTHVRTSGAVLGSPSYFAPEQVNDPKAISPASDQYALGVILYECVTGLLPYEGPSLAAIFQAIMEGNAQAGDRLPPRSAGRLSKRHRPGDEPRARRSICGRQGDGASVAGARVAQDAAALAGTSSRRHPAIGTVSRSGHRPDARSHPLTVVGHRSDAGRFPPGGRGGEALGSPHAIIVVRVIGFFSFARGSAPISRGPLGARRGRAGPGDVAGRRRRHAGPDAPTGTESAAVAAIRGDGAAADARRSHRQRARGRDAARGRRGEGGRDTESGVDAADGAERRPGASPAVRTEPGTTHRMKQHQWRRGGSNEGNESWLWSLRERSGACWRACLRHGRTAARRTPSSVMRFSCESTATIGRPTRSFSARTRSRAAPARPPSSGSRSRRWACGRRPRNTSAKRWRPPAIRGFASTARPSRSPWPTIRSHVGRVQIEGGQPGAPGHRQWPAGWRAAAA